MTCIPPILRTPTRLLRAAILGVYALLAALGSGGLHAIAPTCCTAPGQSTGEAGVCVAHQHGTHQHSHVTHGCSHSHRSHSHAAPTASHSDKSQSDAPCHDENCLICKNLATRALRAEVYLPALMVGQVSEACLATRPLVTVEPVHEFWSRGPPQC